jgi:transcription initiation factor TFIIB
MFELDRLISQLGLPTAVKETAAILYRRVLRDQITHGRRIIGVAGACVYLACRLHDIPRTMKEIAEKSQVSEKDIGRNSRHISQELHLHIPPISAKAFIPRFAETLNLNGDTRQSAIQLLNKARSRQITVGKAPNGLAAASLYITAILKGDPRTQSEIAEVSGVSEVTIRARYKELVDELDISI